MVQPWTPRKLWTWTDQLMPQWSGMKQLFVAVAVLGNRSRANNCWAPSTWQTAWWRFLSQLHEEDFIVFTTQVRKRRLKRTVEVRFNQKIFGWTNSYAFSDYVTQTTRMCWMELLFSHYCYFQAFLVQWNSVYQQTPYHPLLEGALEVIRCISQLWGFQ